MFIELVNDTSRHNGGSYVVGPGGEFLLQRDEKPDVEEIGLHIGGVRDLMRNGQRTWMSPNQLRPQAYVL